MSSPECAFCAIASGIDRDAREVYRDSGAVAFFPNEPATLGHTLLVPLRHVPEVWSLSEGEAGHLGRLVVRTAQAIGAAVAPEGLSIIQSNGRVATQTVPHLHIHLVPRWEGDALGEFWPAQTDFTDAQKDDVWAKVRRECERGDLRG